MDRKTIDQLFDLTRTLLSATTSSPKTEPAPPRGAGLAEIGRIRSEAGLGPWQPRLDVMAILAPRAATSEGPFAWADPPGPAKPSSYRDPEPTPHDESPPHDDPPPVETSRGAAGPAATTIPEDPQLSLFDRCSPAPESPTRPIDRQLDLFAQADPEPARVSPAPVTEPTVDTVVPDPPPAVADPPLPLEDQVKALAESQVKAAAALQADNVSLATTLYTRSLRESACEAGPPVLWLFAATSLLGLVHCEPTRASTHARAALLWARRHHARMRSDASLDVLIKAVTVLAAKAPPQELAAAIQDGIAALQPERDDPTAARVLVKLQLQLHTAAPGSPLQRTQTNPFRLGIQSASFTATTQEERR